MKFECISIYVCVCVCPCSAVSTELLPTVLDPVHRKDLNRILNKHLRSGAETVFSPLR